MEIHGESTSRSRTPRSTADVIQTAFEHRHEVVHLIYAAANHSDAAHRLADLLRADPAQIEDLLNQPLRNMLPEYRDQLPEGSGKGADTMSA
jgi:hypothetical protein